MTKSELINDLEQIAPLIRSAQISLDKGYLAAAVAYLDDLESEAIRIRKAVEVYRENNPKPVAANFKHPNDPAFVPYQENE
jgi:hypothetical protein